MLASLARPIVFAHRGASACAPENTVASFRRALEDGADAIELDAKLSKDRQVVVFHDRTLDRTTDGRGGLSDKTFNELRELDAGSHFAAPHHGERIPLLNEVFELLGRKLFINVELTNYWTPWDDLVERVCQLVRKHALQGRILFSSFFAPNLSKAGRLLPEVPRGLLARRGWRGAWARSFGFTFGDYVALHPNFVDLSPQQVQRVHRLGRRVHAWTVNNSADISRLSDWGVDGISTDDPRAALRVLGRCL